MRAYETRNTVFDGVMLYAIPTRGCLASAADAVVLVAANAKVERPVLPGDRVHQVERKFLHVSMPVKTEQTATVRQVVGEERRARRACSHAIHEARVIRNDAAIRVLCVERRQKRRIHDSKLVVLSEKGLLIDDPELDVVNAFDVGNVSPNAGVGQLPILARGFDL